MNVYRSFLYNISITTLFFILTPIADAGWQVAQPKSTIPREPFFQAETPHKLAYVPCAYGTNVFPNKFAHLGQPASRYAVSISGSLKENIERIMGRYHWKVVWKAPYDYNFDGRVCGSSLQNVLEKLLEPFPLQAQMYMANRIVAIVPRPHYKDQPC